MVLSQIDFNQEEADWRLRVFDSLSFPTLILKPDMTILSANKIFLETHNVAISEVAGKKCHEIFYESHTPCDAIKCPVIKVLQDKKGHSVLKHVFVDSEKRWEDRVFSPILDENDEISYIIESIRDVTRIKSLENELTGIKEFVERVVQSSASAIVAADRKGKILIMNKAAEDLFGYTIWDLLNKKTAKDLYPPGQAKEIMQMLRDTSIGGKGKLPNTKIKILSSIGEEIPVEIAAAIIYDQNGRESATMGIYNDLREKIAVENKLKKTQKQLAQSEKMASLGQLAAGVAHEINNPLTGILFYANLLLENLSEDDSMCEDLNYIIEDVNRCKDIVKNLLTYSRQKESKKKIIHLNDLVDQSLGLIRDQKLFSNIKLFKDMSNEMMMVFVDTSQLGQVLINLVMNAMDAMNYKGVLSIKTHRNKLAKKGYLEVRDTGRGIDSKNLNKIFDPFFTTKEPGKGTGLGLSTAYGIIQENGGAIMVKETGRNGTTFLIELPLHVASDAIK